MSNILRGEGCLTLEQSLESFVLLDGQVLIYRRRQGTQRPLPPAGDLDYLLPAEPPVPPAPLLPPDPMLEPGLESVEDPMPVPDPDPELLLPSREPVESFP